MDITVKEEWLVYFTSSQTEEVLKMAAPELACSSKQTVFVQKNILNPAFWNCELLFFSIRVILWLLFISALPIMQKSFQAQLLKTASPGSSHRVQRPYAAKLFARYFISYMPLHFAFSTAINCWNQLFHLDKALLKAGAERWERPFLALNYSTVGLWLTLLILTFNRGFCPLVIHLDCLIGWQIFFYVSHEFT